jgi:hypothetical protein
VRIKKLCIRNITDILGWKTPKKIVVIESDDWGSIRMPSGEVYHNLLRQGYNVDKDPFLKYDSLASESDLINLMEVLSSVKDKNGDYAKMTLNTIMVNPDFDRIRKCDFQEYHYELFTETLAKYPNHKGSFRLWQEGMRKQLFHPQFHGREHINVDQWMKALQKNDRNIMEAFNNNMISISSEPLGMTFGYMEALDYYSIKEKENKISIVKDGLEHFEKVFGYGSKSFMGSCFVWDDEIERTLNEKGVKYIQGIVRQLKPSIKNEKHGYKKIYHYTGQKNYVGQTYLVRNAAFEPCMNEPHDVTDTCLKEIGIAFRFRTPAIISAHRFNFIGNINVGNRDRNLAGFKNLLSKIICRWPDVEFMFSDELGNEINGKS